MDTLESLAKRIDTTNGLQSIVRTMKALSAARIAQYDRASASMSQYMRTIEIGLTVVLQGATPPAQAGAGAWLSYGILFGSDHSLCGGFNEIIVHAASAERAASPERSWRWLAVGARAAQSLEAAGHTTDDCITLPGTSSGLIETSHNILLTIDAWRVRHGITHVLLFHHRRREQAATPHRVQLLPPDRNWLNQLARRPRSSRTIPMFTMEATELFSALVREHLSANVFRSGPESLASEHTTRVAAMQAALRSIEEHIEEMTADYRRKRQDAITGELLDIVADYESLRERHRRYGTPTP